MFNEPRKWELQKLKAIQSFFEEQMMCTMRFDIAENTIKINMTQAGGKSITKTFDRQTALFESFEQNVKSYFYLWLEGVSNEKKNN